MAERTQFTLAMFSPHVGDAFRCQGQSGEDCQLQLVEATGRDGPEGAEPEQFSLVFFDPDASVDSYLPQAIYPLEHQTLGSLSIFIVPIGPDPQRNGMRYEAVFT